jgi:photosystem II stability/assembly factor-like uncharacterized protein
VDESGITRGSVVRSAVLLVALGVLLVLPSGAFAAGGGWPAETAGTTQDLSGIVSTDDAHGWAVGDGGTIVSTQDGGTTWLAQTSNTTQNLHAVVFSDGAHGWAVGDGGTIVSTHDGGATWTQQGPGTTQNLHALAFADGAHGWAVGDAGTILTTADGGATWVSQASGTAVPLNGIYFRGLDTGWAVGEGGTILNTGNGGATWTQQASGTTQNLHALAFADGAHGWAVGDGGTVLTTADGGATWTAQTSGVTQALDAAAFVDSARGWAVGAGGTLLRTSNGGATWAAQISNTTENLDDVAFADAERGLICGAAGTILNTTDGGILDTSPPLTTATGLGANGWSVWCNSSQTVTLYASDAGSGVAATYYTLDDGLQQTYQTPSLVSAPGSHRITYWSLDWAGNLEKKHTGYVNIDTGRPVCRALGNSSARPGTVARLAYRIDDPPPSCGEASVAITIYRGQKPVKRTRIARVLVNRALAYAFTVGLRAGTYTWVVAATDIAGNEAKPVSARLVVPDQHVEKAVNWALAQRGSHGWDYRCLAFVCDAYQHAGVTPRRWSSAIVAASALGASSNKGAPPRGAWVFYRHAPWGHAALSLGDGRIVHDFGSQGVIVSNYRHIGFSYIGWAVPKTTPQVTLVSRSPY